MKANSGNLMLIITTVGVMVLLVLNVVVVSLISDYLDDKNKELPVVKTEAKVVKNPGTGNGAPAGTHYTLNIHAKKSTWDPGEMTVAGNNIFILTDVPCKINLVKDTSFFVADSNCTDGVAEYHLPEPTTVDDPSNTLYSVFMRPLGKPNGTLSMQSCAMYDDDEDPTTPEVELCSIEKVNTVRMKGKSTFLNVSPELLSLVVSFDDGLTYVRVPLFDTRYPLLDGYMWNTKGNAKIVQLRFYPGVVTTLAQP